MDRTYISDDDNVEDLAVQEYGGVTHSIERNSSALEARDPAATLYAAGIPVISEDTKVRLAIRTSQVCVPGAYVSNEALRPKPSQRQIAEIGLMRERQKNRAYVDDEPHRPVPAPVSEEKPIEDLQGRMHNFQKEADLKDDIENMQLKKAKRKRYAIIGVVVTIFLIVAIAVGVGVGLSTSRDNAPSTAKETLSFDECYMRVNDDRSIRFMELRSIVISGYPDVAVAVDTVGGTARAALCWLTHLDKHGLQAIEGSEVQVVQRFALACIYYNLAGAANADTEKRLTLMSNWLSSRSVCEWDYVGCNQSDKTVAELHLENLSLEGAHLEELPLLSNLALLDLRNNMMFGQIPSGVFSLSKLTELRLENNPLNVEIASELTGLSQLQVLTFGDNFLTGTIPSRLFGLSQLRKLHLGRNRLRGTIPDEVNHASSLVELYIDANQLTGTIPDLHNLPELSLLKIHFNSFDGSFPDISSCTNLESLDMDSVTINGKLSLWSLVKLTHLNLEFTSLSGTIPNEIGDLSNLEFMNIHGSDISGTLPTTLGQLSELKELKLHSSNIEGPIPTQLGQLSNIETLLLPNLMTGSVPTELCSLLDQSLTALEAPCTITCQCCTQCN